MKIFDSSAIVAILWNIKCPGLIRCMSKMQHDLVLPCCVYREILNGPAASACAKMIEERALIVAGPNKASDLMEFKKHHTSLGLGEIDVMLTYEGLAGKCRSYCILDDMDARKTAESRGIRFTGLLGLLRMMRIRGIMSPDEFDGAVGALKRSGFYMPAGF